MTLWEFMVLRWQLSSHQHYQNWKKQKLHYSSNRFSKISNLNKRTNTERIIDVWLDINSKVFITQGKEKEEAMVPSMEYLKFLEEKLKGKKFFGGDTIRFVDLALAWLANLISILEEIVGLKVGDGEKFPLCLHGPKILQMLQSLKVTPHWDKMII